MFSMNSVLEKLKSDLIYFSECNDNCIDNYDRLYSATSIEKIMDLIKDNFFGYCEYNDFAKVILAYRELFSKYNIFINQDVSILKGIGYICVSDGTVYIEGLRSSVVNVVSCNTSTIKINSRNTSVVNINSHDNSTIEVRGINYSKVSIDSLDSSSVNIESYDNSMISIFSQDTSLANIRGYDNSIVRCYSFDSSKINVDGNDTSTTIIRCCDCSYVNVLAQDHSTMIVHEDSIVGRTCGNGIIRYIQDDKIAVLGDWLSVSTE